MHIASCIMLPDGSGGPAEAGPASPPSPPSSAAQPEPGSTLPAGRPLRVAFIHPDLGLGGAERLVVDAAAELVKLGHRVDVFTAHYDPARCFEETRTGGFAVHTAGSWFPRSVLGRMLALCAYVRCLLVAWHVAWRWRRWRGRSRSASSPPLYDVVFADQVQEKKDLVLPEI